MSDVVLGGEGRPVHIAKELSGATGVTIFPNPLTNSAVYKAGFVTVVGNIAAPKLVG